MQLTTKQQYWLNHITAAKQSKQAMSAYAVQHNLCVKALYSWKWQLKQLNIPTAKKENPFIQITSPSIRADLFITGAAVKRRNASQWHIASNCTRVAHQTKTRR